MESVPLSKIKELLTLLKDKKEKGPFIPGRRYYPIFIDNHRETVAEMFTKLKKKVPGYADK